MEDDMRSMWVYKDIELCLRGRIAVFLNGSTHDDQFPHGFCKLWRLANREGDVGQRADREDADLIGICENRFDQIIHRMCCNRLGLWGGQLRVSDSTFPVYVRG